MQVPRLSIENSVVLTLSYSQVFSKPLTLNEIFVRLLHIDADIPVSPNQVQEALHTLRANKKVIKYGEYWQLNPAGKNLSLLRKKRERLSAMKLQELQPFISFAKYIGWIRGIAVTGSVSVENADAKDDVDLMIVVQSNRMWLVRPVLVAFSFLKGKRRSWNKEEYNSWCLNLWLEEHALSVPPEKRSMYTAYEVCQAAWVISKGAIEKKFIQDNSWINRYIPQYFSYRLKHLKASTPPTDSVSLADPLLTSLNHWAYVLQRQYMQRHMTTESVGGSFAFFHPRDTRRSIVSEWKKIIEKIS